MRDLKALLFIIWKSLISPFVWLMSFCVGLIINGLQTGHLFHSYIPFFVPLFVQVLSRTILGFKNRHRDYLVMLPSKRKDPAFIMDTEGHVLYCSGNTKEYFDSREIHSLSDLLGGATSSRILKHLELIRADIQTLHRKESDAPKRIVEHAKDQHNRKYYQVKLELIPSENHVLVWCNDRTEQKRLERKLGALRELSTGLLESNLNELRPTDINLNLAELILRSGYEGVFITYHRVLQGQNVLRGSVYKWGDTGDIHQSNDIVVTPDSKAPIWKSRLEKKVVAELKKPEESPEEFRERWPFHEEVVQFLGKPVTSFVNYHAGDVSIIAFNKQEISTFDKSLMETLAAMALSLEKVVVLKLGNERLFRKAVAGLCAAAEFSDEITGKHIGRVNKYCELIARQLGLDENFCTYIGEVASMHDIGKVAIPHIIKLDRKLTEQEREEMQIHPVVGANILAEMQEEGELGQRLQIAMNIALHHHQHWDGSGYPKVIYGGSVKREDYLNFTMRKIAGEDVAEEIKEWRAPHGNEIPMEARIAGLADVYDALRSPRQYKPAFSHEKAIGIIREDERSGIRGQDKFGPDLMELFEEIHPQMDVIYNAMAD